MFPLFLRKDSNKFHTDAFLRDSPVFHCAGNSLDICSSFCYPSSGFSPESFLIRAPCSLYKNECWDEEVSRETEIEIPVGVGTAALPSPHTSAGSNQQGEGGGGAGGNSWWRPCPLWSVILWRRTLTPWWTCLACSPRLYSPLEYCTVQWFLKDNGQQILAVLLDQLLQFGLLQANRMLFIFILFMFILPLIVWTICARVSLYI